MSNSLPTAIITGASRGIGRALAILLAQNNFQLSLVARNKGELKDLAAEITDMGIDLCISMGMYLTRLLSNWRWRKRCILLDILIL